MRGSLYAFRGVAFLGRRIVREVGARFVWVFHVLPTTLRRVILVVGWGS